MDERFKEGVGEGRAAWQDALRGALLTACAEGARDVFCFDRDFTGWPWSEAEVLAGLTAWVRPPRRLTLIATQFEELQRRQPRFVTWRQRYDHCFSAWANEPQSGDGASFDAALVALGSTGVLLSLRLLDAARWRFTASLQKHDGVLLQDWFDVAAQRCTPAFAASTLGL